tara:strand:- start:1170 stop:1589 length:420 start_codon:yes stop_codon:yes gene_type:complete
MPFTLFSRILPSDVANIIFNFVKKIQNTQKIYWEQLYSPASFIIKKLMKKYSDYSKVFHPTSYVYNDLMIITRITNRVAAKGLIQKNIYIHMDEYIDNLRILKKHLEFHFKDKRQVSLLWSQTFICGQFMIQYLDEHID